MLLLFISTSTSKDNLLMFAKIPFQDKTVSDAVSETIVMVGI